MNDLAGQAGGRGALEALRVDLDNLHRRIGKPSSRGLEGLARQLGLTLSRSGVSDLLKGPSQPKWATVEGFVRACQAHASRSSRHGAEPVPDALFDLDRWQLKHEAAVREREATKSTLTITSTTPTTGAPHGPIRLWNLPWQRNPHFMGRTADLAVLSHRFLSPRDRPLAQALLGLSGMGKTQLAVEYAHQYADEYQIVWWAPASNAQQLRQSMAQLARRLGLEMPGDLDASAAAALGYLRGPAPSTRWLVIVDGAGDPAPLLPYLPSAHAAGNLLVTSTDRRWTAYCEDLHVDVISREASVALLQQHVQQSSAACAGLANVLGDLPIALQQAGSWLSNSGMDILAYTEQVERNLLEVLNLNLAPGYPQPLTAVWLSAVNALRESDAHALALLELCSFMASEAIPIGYGSPRVDRRAEPFAGGRLLEPLPRASAAAELSMLSLARVGEGLLSVHVLLQRLVRQTCLDAASSRVAAQRFLAAADPGDPDDARTWEQYQLLVPHLPAVQATESEDPLVHDLVLNVSWYLHTSGDYQASELLERTAVEAWSNRLGRRNEATLRMLSNLAGTLLAQGSPKEAWMLYREVYQSSLTLRGRHGRRSVHSISALANMAYVERDLGRAARAGRRFRVAIAHYERELGKEHQLTLVAVFNLAYAQRLAGAIAEAWRTCADVRARLAAALDEDHPWTIAADSELAWHLANSGDMDAAEALDRNVLERRRNVLGASHPHTLRAADRLAGRGQALVEPDARQGS